MALLMHHIRAEEPQLDAASGVHDIVDAAMERMKTAQHPTVRSIYNGVYLQGGDISLPQHQLRIPRERGQRCAIRHATFVPLVLQEFILHLEKVTADRLGQAHVHQAAQQILLFLLLGGDGNSGIPGIFPQQLPNQIHSLFPVGHGISLLFSVPDLSIP